MTKEELKKGVVVCHRKYERHYLVFSVNCRFKRDTDGQWVDGVLYKPLYDNEYELFMREIGSFLEEFDLVE